MKRLLWPACAAWCVAAPMAVLMAACTHEPRRTEAIVVFSAGSLAVPLRAALDTFARREGVRVEQENAGSVETARKLTDLGRIPDVIALADQELFPRLLVPRYVETYTPFARNRMVLAYTPSSRYAAEVEAKAGAGRWWDVVTRAGVEIGRSDPTLDPAGYRALLVFRLAERRYGVPGLARRLEAAAPARNVRPKSADLTALLQSGNLDYAWEYESVARATGVRFLTLPPDVDLGTPADSASYASVTLRVAGPQGDSVTVRGAPIVYAVAVPRSAPHGDVARRFVTFLTSPAGRVILRAHDLDAFVPSRGVDTP